MSTDKGLKSSSRYIKSAGEKRTRKVFRVDGQEKPLAFFSSLDHNGRYSNKSKSVAVSALSQANKHKE